MLSKEYISILERPFHKDVVRFKVQSLSRNRDKALIVAYLQHTDVYRRLEEVDPDWSCEALTSTHSTPKDDNYTLFFVEMKMTVRGVTRCNVGEGEDPKSAYSDAVKRCAMLFGVGRYLYDSETVWVPYNESQDKYREWTWADYDKHLRNSNKLPILDTPDEVVMDHNPNKGNGSIHDAPENPPSEVDTLKLDLKRTIWKIREIDKSRSEDEYLGFFMQNDKAKFEHIAKAHTPKQIASLTKALVNARQWIKAKNLMAGTAFSVDADLSEDPALD